MTVTTKKVLFLITKATWGGAQRYIFDLATHLPHEQFGTAVAFGTPGRLQELLEARRIPTRRIPALDRDVSFFSDIAAFFEIMQVLRAERPDVVHLNSSKAAALGALAARTCGIKKIIFTAHGWPFKEDRNAPARALIYFLSWFTALLSDIVIVVSKTDEEIGARMWLVGSKIRSVPLGVEPPAFLSREDAAAALSVSTDAPRIVTVAELTRNKGIGYAIEAMAALKQRSIECEYFIVGAGELRRELETLVREKGLADRIHFLGFVPDASKYLKAFDLFLLPSIKEGMPYVLLEAAAAGLPVLATKAVDTAFTAQIPTRDATAIAEGVLKIQGRKTIVPVPLTLQIMMERTAELY